MANQIVCVLAETYGLRIYAIMLPPSEVLSLIGCLLKTQEETSIIMLLIMPSATV